MFAVVCTSLWWQLFLPNDDVAKRKMALSGEPTLRPEKWTLIMLLWWPTWRHDTWITRQSRSRKQTWAFLLLIKKSCKTWIGVKNVPLLATKTVGAVHCWLCPRCALGTALLGLCSALQCSSVSAPVGEKYDGQSSPKLSTLTADELYKYIFSTKMKRGLRKPNKLV